MAGREFTFDLSREVVVEEVLKFARAAGWRRTPRSVDGAALSFVQQRGFSLAAQQQEISVFVDRDGDDRTVVLVETQAKTWFGSRQLFDWGQGARLAMNVLDAISEREGPAAPATN